VRSQESVESPAGGIDSFEDIPVSSVFYVGRGSFRMEATPAPEVMGAVGEPMTRIRTAPIPDATDARESSAPKVNPLFSSHDGIPTLVAPSGSASLHAPSITLTRGSLVALGAVLLLCGVLVETAARHLFASTPRALTNVPASPTAAPAPVAVAPAPVAAPAPVEVAAPAPIVTVPTPVAIHARAKAPVAKAPATTPPKLTAPKLAPAKAQAKTWVDPWAE
jgi:hypothetical protein